MAQQVVLKVCLTLVLVVSPGVVSAAQDDQTVIARHLLGNDPVLRGEALNDTRSLRPPMIGPELRSALMILADRQNEMVRRVTARSEPVVRFVNPEFHARVCETIAELRDRAAIAVLARGLGACGFLVHRYLAEFGDLATPAVLAVVTSPASSYESVSEGLIALRFIVENASERPVSPASLERIRRAAEQRLTGRQYFSTLGRAIDLAIVLRDPDLRTIVESLASDSRAVVARGIEKAELIDHVQAIAKNRLAGLPPLPRHD
jgi:hypothetical protein